MAQILVSELKQKTDAIVSKYETKRASILEVLRLVMENQGHIALEAEVEVAEYLGLPAIDVREVMTFYSLFYSKPKPKTRFHVCRTLSCSLMGNDKIISYLEKKLGIKPGQMTPDGTFSVDTVECLGACEIAPMMQLNDGEYVGCLTESKIDQLTQSKK